VIGADPVPASADAAAVLGCQVLGLDDVIAQADVLSLNLPMAPENRHLLDAARLGSMRRGALLVNTARGPLVDEAALAEALRDGRLAGAALDVFETEPLPADSPLRDLPNVILGSHNASNTVEAVRRVNRLAIENLLAVLDAVRA